MHPLVSVLAALLVLSWPGVVVPIRVRGETVEVDTSEVDTVDTVEVEVDYRGQQLHHIASNHTATNQTQNPGENRTTRFTEPLFSLPRTSRRGGQGQGRGRGQGDARNHNTKAKIDQTQTVEQPLRRRELYEVSTIRNRFVVSYEVPRPFSDAIPHAADYEEVTSLTESFLTQYFEEDNHQEEYGSFEGMILTQATPTPTTPTASTSRTNAHPNAKAVDNPRQQLSEQQQQQWYTLNYITIVEFRYKPVGGADQAFADVTEAVTLALETDYFSSLFYLVELNGMGPTNPFRKTTSVTVRAVNDDDDSTSFSEDVILYSNSNDDAKNLPIAHSNSNDDVVALPIAYSNSNDEMENLPPTFSDSNDVENLPPAFSDSSDANDENEIGGPLSSASSSTPSMSPSAAGPAAISPSPTAMPSQLPDDPSPPGGDGPPPVVDNPRLPPGFDDFLPPSLRTTEPASSAAPTATATATTTVVPSNAPSVVPSGISSRSLRPTKSSASSIISFAPIDPIISPMPTTSSSPTGPTVSPFPSTSNMPSTDPSSNTPSEAPTVSTMPSTSTNPTVSSFPTLRPTTSPAPTPPGPQCLTRANTDICSVRSEDNIQLDKFPHKRKCDCYNFCDRVFVGCCRYEEECKIDCLGFLVAGCEPIDPKPTRPPRPPTKKPTGQGKPKPPSPEPSSSPTAQCRVSVNQELCPSVTQSQEPVEGCNCYNYCNGEFNGCCAYYDDLECKQLCFGTVIAGCELDLAPELNQTFAPAPSAFNETSGTSIPTPTEIRDPNVPQPISEPGGGGGSPTNTPITAPGGGGGSPNNVPITAPGGGGGSPNNVPIAEPGGSGGSSNIIPITEPGGAGGSPNNVPIIEPGGGGGSPNNVPIAEPGGAGGSPNNGPIIEPGGGGGSPNNVPITEPGGGGIPNASVADPAPFPEALEPGSPGEGSPGGRSPGAGTPGEGSPGEGSPGGGSLEGESSGAGSPEGGSPGEGPPGEPNNGDDPIAPPGGRKRETPGSVILPLYQLSFSFSSTARRILFEEPMSKKELYPTLDDFSMIERVVSRHIFLHLAKSITERESDRKDAFGGLSLMVVKTEVDATHLETHLKTEELQIDLKTTLVFEDDFIASSTKMAQHLSDIVGAFFVEEASLEDFVQKLQAESAALHNGDGGYFTVVTNISTKISWAYLDDDASGDIVNFELPLHSSLSNKSLSSNPASTKPSIALVVLYVLVLFILASTIGGLLLLRRQRHKKKRIWLKPRFCMDDDSVGNSRSDTIVFSDSEADKNTIEDGGTPVEHIHISEQDAVSTYSSPSLFWPLDKFIYDEDTETSDEDREIQYFASPSPQRIDPSWNGDTTRGDDDVDSQALILQKYEDILRSTQLPQERSKNHEEKLTNNALKDDDNSQSSSLAQLKIELAEARLE